MATDMDARALCDEIVARRHGHATCQIVDRTEPTALASADAITTRCGFKPLGTRWRQIERSVALEAVTRVLERDLAYESPILESSEARAYAERFAALFDPEASWFTNGDLACGGNSWDPITSATFDTGVIAVDADRAGLLWVDDND